MKKQITAILLLIVLCFSFVPQVQAEEEAGQTYALQVKRVEGDTKSDRTLSILRIEDEWYAQQESLAELVGCKPTHNENSGIIGFVRQSPAIILCTFKEEQCVQSQGSWYVPLQEAACKTGLEFDVRDGQIHVYVRRTPQDLSNVLFELFRDQQLYITNVMLQFKNWEWILAESLARGYAMLSPFKSSGFLNELFGIEDARRYEEAMGTILATDGETSGLFTAMATGDKFTKSLTEDAELLWYCRLGGTETDTPFSSVYNELVREMEIGDLKEVESIGDMAAILDEYKQFKKEVPFSEALKVMKYWELALNAEASLLQTMNLVFKDSDNEYAKEAVAKIMAYNGGGWDAATYYSKDTGVRFALFYTDKAIKKSIELVDEGFSAESAIGKLCVEFLFNRILRLDKKSDFIIYIPIYGAIQQEIIRYYFDHSDDDDVNWFDMRACGITYAKAAMGAVENLKFDTSMQNTVDYMLSKAKYYLEALMGYSKEEYDPTYTNEGLIAYLQETYPEEQETSAPWKNAEELLNEHRYWSWIVGVTAAGLYHVELHEDYSARVICSSAINYADKEVIGGYEEPVGWFYADGVLTICGIEHYWNGEEFLTEELYQMQSPTIQRPLRFSPDENAEECAEYFRYVYNDTTSEATSVPTTPTPTVTATPTPYTPTETGNPSINDMLKPGDLMPFGTYERDNDLYNGPEDIQWIVLDKVGDEVLLISRYVLDCGIYNEKDPEVQWKDSELRYWLNNTFYQKAFTQEEKAKIIEKEARADWNPDYDTYPGTSTRDKVTLLSISEAQKYFSSNSNRACKATEYAIAQGVEVDGNGNSWWWLRTPGQLNGYAAGVFRNGEIDPVGDVFNHGGDGIRPVIWVNFDKDTSTNVNFDKGTSTNTNTSTKGSGAELSAGELAWFNEWYPYGGDGFISVTSSDFAAPQGSFSGYIIPWTAQFYSEDQGIVLVRITEEMELDECRFSSDYVKGLRVGDTIQLMEYDPIEIRSIAWDDGNCIINDFYVLLSNSDGAFEYRMPRMVLNSYGDEGMLTWIAIGNDTQFIASDGTNFNAESDSYRRYIETYGGWKVNFSIADDRCTWMYESGLAG